MDFASGAQSHWLITYSDLLSPSPHPPRSSLGTFWTPKIVEDSHSFRQMPHMNATWAHLAAILAPFFDIWTNVAATLPPFLLREADFLAHCGSLSLSRADFAAIWPLQLSIFNENPRMKHGRLLLLLFQSLLIICQNFCCNFALYLATPSRFCSHWSAFCPICQSLSNLLDT